MTANTVQTFFGTKPYGANEPVGNPITPIDAVKILDNLVSNKYTSCCTTIQNAYFGYDIVSGKPQMTFELLGNTGAYTSMPCKYISDDAIRAMPTRKKIRECITRASMGKCRDEYMCQNIWSIIFPDKYAHHR